MHVVVWIIMIAIGYEKTIFDMHRFFNEESLQ